MMAQCQGEDDKYAKASKQASPGALSKYHEAVHALNKSSTLGRLTSAVFSTAFLPYSCLLVMCGIFYYYMGGDLTQIPQLQVLRYLSTVAEALGLIALRRKIAQHQSAVGVSGMTIIMYVFVYMIREVLMIPPWTKDSLDDWMVEVLTFVSLLMVCDVLRSVLVTYRKTYQEDLDVLNVKYLVPGCFVLAFIVHPDLNAGQIYNYAWTTCLYLDVLALMPQVVMMSKGNGKVAAPISNFVAATALSRCVDLQFWYHGIYLVDFWSAMIIILFHVVHLALIADFLYYYLKARFSGSLPSEDLLLPSCDMA